MYQCLKGLPNYDAATELAVDIMLGDVEAFGTARGEARVNELKIGSCRALQYDVHLAFVILIPSVTEYLPLDELPEECPRLEQLNAGQRAALERAYQSKFHIIQGAPGVLSTVLAILTNMLTSSECTRPTLPTTHRALPFPLASPTLPFLYCPISSISGTKKLVVAVHLAYAFAQKNKRIGVRKATGKQYCVLLCAPDDAAVDKTLCELCVYAVCELCTYCTYACVGIACKYIYVYMHVCKQNCHD